MKKRIESSILIVFRRLLDYYEYILRKLRLIDIIYKYVVPYRIFHSLRRKRNRDFGFDYLVDILTKRKLRNRMGNCKMCGACCEGCEELIKNTEGGICRIYKRRVWCDVYFPISKAQLEKISNNLFVCGYSFKK